MIRYLILLLLVTTNLHGKEGHLGPYWFSDSNENPL